MDKLILILSKITFSARCIMIGRIPVWIDVMIGQEILINGHKTILRGYSLAPCRFRIPGNTELVLETDFGMINTRDSNYTIPDEVKKQLPSFKRK